MLKLHDIKQWFLSLEVEWFYMSADASYLAKVRDKAIVFLSFLEKCRETPGMPNDFYKKA